jgi:hypothetical protein
MKAGKAKSPSIRDLTPDPRNANKGSERGTGMLEHSLRSYGAGRSILADKHGVIIAGNKTLVDNFSDQNDLLYEPFGGSGTTIIAAETLHRRCFAVEIEPKFCQLIVDRFERFTNTKAQKLGELVSQ